MDSRHLFKVYNIPSNKGDCFKDFINQIVKTKNIWIAKDESCQNDADCVGWAWIEYFSKDDMVMAKPFINGIIWHSHVLTVLD